ncbi:MAG: peptidase domain protein [Acidimicrobiales bacterium]|nr:peptidase domain protein [Acidimicrobiales bacterium]
MSISAGAWVGVGARDEPEQLSGVSHFLEHLLFKGSETRSAREISQTIDRVGGDINAFTAKEYTAYYCRLPARHQALGISLLGDVLTSPALRDDDVENERHVILEELAMDDDSPDDVAHRAFMRHLFPEHPLGWETAGSVETVEAIVPDDVRTFFGQHYRAGSTVVAVSGPLDHHAALDQVTEAFAALTPGDGRIARTAPGAATSGEIIDDDTEQVHIVLGMHGLRRSDSDREALDVVNHVFGGGLSSRLFDEIRERRGLAYSVYSGVSSYADAGAFTIYAGTQPAHATQVMELIHEQLELLIKDGITDDELDIAKGYLTGAFELGLEDTGSRMARSAGLLVTTGEIRPVADQVARWDAVQHDDTRRVIERIFSQPLTLIALGPLDAASVPVGLRAHP